ncbi:MAG: hypothetical protein IKE49_04875 [Firmicutes bacterium]|nr:hypothetical protein [Bacillota bacterium]
MSDHERRLSTLEGQMSDIMEQVRDPEGRLSTFKSRGMLEKRAVCKVAKKNSDDIIKQIVNSNIMEEK